ncbi:MAG: pyridoxal phosphate-dependent aminotransferase family protein [Saprospiraceae bacterium]
MDLFAKLEKQMGPIGNYMNQADGYFTFPKLEGPLGNRMQFQGREVICWSINNYLGLANHPEVMEADRAAAEKWGLAYPMGARMMSGQTDEHLALEKDLAELVQKESVYLLNYGYQGIMSAIDALIGRADVVVYDAESHACIIDGLRMHLGKRFAFVHNDMESLESCLVRAERLVEGTDGSILVISEGVFGMRGDQGKLKEIIDLKKKFQFRLLVDDAHGFGTLGENGAGAGVEQGVQDGIDIYFSTFAKSFASIGAFLAADKFVIDFLRYNMRSQIFAKTLPITIVSGARKRLDMMINRPELKEKLWSNVHKLQAGLKERGLDIGNTNTCITPIYLNGTTEEAMAMVYDLRENFGIFCSIVVYPVVPKGMIILRIIPTAAHTDADIEESLDAFEAVSKNLKAGKYSQATPQVV